ncbi:MAG: hypothetical protein H5T92_09760 [Synergistales bacterium]|nr:hypothetical protein [Synergistales bacterium]
MRGSVRLDERKRMMDHTNPKLSEEALQEFMQLLNRLHSRDDQHVTEPNLVTHSEDAHWLRGTTDNPSHLGLLLHLPMKTVEFFLQMIPGGTASDLQRHVHESIHYVIDGNLFIQVEIFSTISMEACA